MVESDESEEFFDALDVFDKDIINFLQLDENFESKNPQAYLL